MPNLLDLLDRDKNNPRNINGRIGVVTAVSGRTVSVNFGTGAAVAGIPCASVYSAPAVSDPVLVISLGSAWIALTKLG